MESVCNFNLKFNNQLYKIGDYLPISLMDSRLKAMRDHGLISMRVVEKNDTSSEKYLMMYLGDHMSKRVTNGLSGYLLRGQVHEVPRKNAEAIIKHYDNIHIFDINGTYIRPDIVVENFAEIKKELPENPQILIMRDMGLGDVALTLPVVKKIYGEFEDCEIIYATLSQYVCLLAGKQYIQKAIPLKEASAYFKTADLVINWCRASENYKISRNRGNRVKSFALHIGLTMDDDEMVEAIYVSPEAKLSACCNVNCINGKYIGYILKAAMDHRSYPIEKTYTLFHKIHEKYPDHKIIVFDNQRSFGLWKHLDYVVDLSGQTSIQEAIEIAKLCDLVIGPDTGLTHLFCSANIKTIVLLSSIPFEWRYDHYGSNVLSVDNIGYADCIPCWDWQRDYGKVKYCSHTHENVCLSKLDDGKIINKIEEVFV